MVTSCGSDLRKRYWAVFSPHSGKNGKLFVVDRHSFLLLICILLIGTGILRCFPWWFMRRELVWCAAVSDRKWEPIATLVCQSALATGRRALQRAHRTSRLLLCLSYHPNRDRSGGVISSYSFTVVLSFNESYSRFRIGSSLRLFLVVLTNFPTFCNCVIPVQLWTTTSSGMNSTHKPILANKASERVETFRTGTL